MQYIVVYTFHLLVICHLLVIYYIVIQICFHLLFLKEKSLQGFDHLEGELPRASDFAAFLVTNSFRREFEFYCYYLRGIIFRGNKLWLNSKLFWFLILSTDIECNLDLSQHLLGTESHCFPLQ